jgi:hypothetical protein
MPSSNGESGVPHAPLELQHALYIEAEDGTSLRFEVVGILEDPQEHLSYAVLVHEPEEGDEQFIVTDLEGNLLENERLAQEILDDFLAYAHDDDDDDAAGEEND